MYLALLQRARISSESLMERYCLKTSSAAKSRPRRESTSERSLRQAGLPSRLLRYAATESRAAAAPSVSPRASRISPTPSQSVAAPPPAARALFRRLPARSFAPERRASRASMSATEESKREFPQRLRVSSRNRQAASSGRFPIIRLPMLSSRALTNPAVSPPCRNDSQRVRSRVRRSWHPAAPGRRAGRRQHTGAP